MTAPLVGLREILEGLEDHQVDYVLFGSVAMLFYGFVRNTDDLDIVVAPDQDNLRRVHDWLISIDARLKLRPGRTFGPRERWSMFRGNNATLLTSFGQIDVVQQIAGMPAFDELVADCESFERDGVKVRVINRRTLIEMKRRRSSALDLADIEAIEALDRLDD